MTEETSDLREILDTSPQAKLCNHLAVARIQLALAIQAMYDTDWDGITDHLKDEVCDAINMASAHAAKAASLGRTLPERTVLAWINNP